MKRILLVLPALFLLRFAQAQTGANVSFSGIGVVKLGMKKAELERAVGQTVVLRNLLRKNDPNRDTVRLTHKGIDYLLVLDKDYRNDKPDFIVVQVGSGSPGLKTRSGITLGDDRLKIVNTYVDYSLHLAPVHDWDTGERKKGETMAILYSDEESTITFYLKDGKVVGFEVMYSEGC